MNPQALRQRNLEAVLDGVPGEHLSFVKSLPGKVDAAARVENGVANGYAPHGYGLADFTIIRKNGLYHLFHIPRGPGDSCIFVCNEHWLGHAVSSDLDTWDTMNPVLCVEPANYYESAHLWAPFVYQQGNESYMYYTGLSREPSQVLCIAQSSDPDLEVWKRYEGNPVIPLDGFSWHWRNDKGHVVSGRDAHVIKVQDHYLMTYTAMHENGCPAVGGLISEDLLHWEDIGPVLYRPTAGKLQPESVNIQSLSDGRWVLVASMSPGLEYYISTDPHHWHGVVPQQIEYEGRPNDQLVAPEVISRNDAAEEWLIAFFEEKDNRMFLGILDLKTDPWKVRRLETADELNLWRRTYDAL